MNRENNIEKKIKIKRKKKKQNLYKKSYTKT